MAIPTTREEFKQYCLRKLGSPVIEINLADEQIDDRIDEALQYYWDYHFDGTEKTYYKYSVTQQDKDNKYITLPDNIIGAVNMFPVGTYTNSGDMFNIRYQIALNDLYTLTSVSMVPYYMTISHLQFLEQLLVGMQPLRYNRISNKLYIDMDWDRISVGEFLVVEAYMVVDPAIYPKVWGERWLQNYATCIIKQNWGDSIKKFDGMKMPGGLTFNGQKIYDEATAEREKLEKDMIMSFSLPVVDMIG